MSDIYQLSGTKITANYKPIPDNIRKNVKRVILFTNARDELKIKEWAAHHLLIGFDLIYIFDHKSNTPLTNVFNNFDKRVIIERCEMNNPIKKTLMKKAVSIAKSMGVDWMLYLDSDEFLVLNSFRGVKHMLNMFNYADQLMIHWLMFGSNFHVKEPIGLIVENYTKTEAKLNQHVKSFVRPSKVTSISNPHFFYITSSVRNIIITNKVAPAQATHNIDLTFEQVHAYIAHYVIQSEETYMRRKVILPADDTNTFRRRDNTTIHKSCNDVDNFHVRDKYAEHIHKLLLLYSS